MRNSSRLVSITKLKLLLWSLVALPTAAIGTSWNPPHDPWLRAELEHLASFHLINQPLSIWPLSTKTLANAKRNLSQNALLSIKSEERNGFNLGLSASGSQPVLTHFGSSSRDKSNSNIAYHYSNGTISTQISSQYIDNEDVDPSLKYDNSFVDIDLGRWTMGVGAIDRWWGPGWDSGLILSSNA
ncbi:MAG: hypothetical protein JKY67_13010 [Pseudomonadales bacterium]|nr:hypothetical protein [Pseudomonadales bacterium]